MPPSDLAQDLATLQRIFTGLGLARPGEPARATPLTGGVSSAICRVDLASGSYCLKQALPRLKVAKLWEVPVERVAYEVAWLRTARGVVPRHVPRVLGEDAATRSFVMEFLGEDHRNWKAELLAGRVDAEVARAVGDVLGRIHAATADRADVARQFATDASFHAIRLEPYLVETARVHPLAADRLHALVERTAATRRVLVHGDVSPKNILLGPAGPVLLDAECAWFGDPAFDLAFCLNHFLLKAAHLPASAAALLAAGRVLATAYLAHARWEPAPDVAQRAAALLPGLTLARIDGKSPVEYLQEPQRQRVRATTLAFLGAPVQSLDNLLARWGQHFAA